MVERHQHLRHYTTHHHRLVVYQIMKRLFKRVLVEALRLAAVIVEHCPIAT